MHVRIRAPSHAHRFSFLFLNLSLQIKYKEDWEKTKSKACDIGLDDLSVKAAKASRDLASDVSKHFEETQSEAALMSEQITLVALIKYDN